MAKTTASSAENWKELTTTLSVDAWDAGTFEEILKNQQGEKSAEFQQLVRTFREYSVSQESNGASSSREELVSDLLIKLQAFCPYFRESHAPLVNAVLSCDWYKASGDVYNEFSLFIVNLVTAQPFFIDSCLKNWIRRFRTFPVEISLDLNVGSFKNLEDKFTCYYGKIHGVLLRAVDIVPLSRPKMMKYLSEGFPFRLRPETEHFVYTYNLLQLLQKHPVNRASILNMLIENIAKMDAEASPTELTELEVDDSDVEDTENECWSTEQPTAERLDLILTLLFEHIESLSADHTGDSPALMQFYRESLSGFDGFVFKCHGLTHVQFVWFYLASLRERINDDLRKRLWQKTMGVGVPVIFRQYGASYLCSYLARAKFVPLKLLVKMVDELVQWIHSYITEYDKVAVGTDGSHIHRVFYSICQNVFYVVTFRHQEIFTQKKGKAWFRAMNLERIIGCTLNPLRYCQQVVQNLFASVTRQHGLLFCYTVIERNKRMDIFAGNKEEVEQDQNANPLSTFFPFEPYVLKRSKKFITPIFRTYGEPVEFDDLPDRETYRGLIADSDDCSSNSNSADGDSMEDKRETRSFVRTSRKRQLSENTA